MVYDHSYIPLLVML